MGVSLRQRVQAKTDLAATSQSVRLTETYCIEQHYRSDSITTTPPVQQVVDGPMTDYRLFSAYWTSLNIRSNPPTRCNSSCKIGPILWHRTLLQPFQYHNLKPKLTIAMSIVLWVRSEPFDCGLLHLSFYPRFTYNVCHSIIFTAVLCI